MNLTKYFNFKFLKEHIKSRAGLIFGMLALLPIFTILYFVILLLNHRTGIILFSSLGKVTLIGAFLIPVVLAFALFGFVLKKKSVDFYLSQPIDRKTIYLTNILGGLILLTGILLLNSFIIYGFNLFSPLVIPFKLVIDYFVYYLSCYIFIFSITSLALSISGNFLSTVVVILLIAFMYPFICLTSMYYHNQDSYQVTNTVAGKRIDFSYSADNYDFTTLVHPFFSEYEVSPVIKTFALSAIYIAIGYYLFKKRKMENNECSFKNIKLYYLIKLATFLPVCFLCYTLWLDFDASLIFISILGAFAYYLIYDLVFQRGYYKLKITFLTFVLAIGIYTILFAGIEKIFFTKKVSLPTIEEITIHDYYRESENLSYRNLVIKDKDIIDKIFQTEGTANLIKTGSIKYKRHYYNTTLAISKSDSTLIDEYINKNNILAEVEKYNFSKTKYITITGSSLKIPITNSLISKLIKAPYDNNYFYIKYELYYYDNHSYQTREIPINASLSIFTEAINTLNKNFLNKATYSNINIAYYVSAEELFANYALNNYILNTKKKELKEYLEKHALDKANDLEDFMIIADTDYKNSSRLLYIITDTKAFQTEWEKWNKELENTDTYQEYVSYYK